MNKLASRERLQPTQFPTYKPILSGILILLFFGIWTIALGSEPPLTDNIAEDGQWIDMGGGTASGEGISANSGESWKPSLAVSSDGSPIIAWEDDSSGSQEIYVKRWNGTNWVEMGSGSASAGGISDNIGASRYPSLAISPAGTPFVAWEDNWDGDDEIYVRRWNGAAWEEVGSGSASGGGISANSAKSFDPSLAISPEGAPIIAWTDRSIGNAEIYVRRWNGSAWVEMGSGSASGGGISANSGDSVEPSLAISPGGVPIIAWSDDSGGDEEIYVRIWNGSAWVELGSSSASNGGISDNLGDSWAPSLAFSPSGVPIIAWTDSSGGDNEIYARRWDGQFWVEIGSSSASGGGISDNNSVTQKPSLAVSPNGTPIIAWEDGSNTPSGKFIYVRRWNGMDWVEIGSGAVSSGYINGNPAVSFSPSLAVGPDGIPIVAWYSLMTSIEHGPLDSEVFAQHWQPSVEEPAPEGGDWFELGGSASGGGISDSAGSSDDSSLAATPDGIPIIAWRDSSGDDSEIYVRRWDGINWVEMGSGSASGGGISNNSGSSWSPSLAVGPDGFPMVAWQDDSSGDWEIYVKRWNGSVWVELGAGSASGGGISNTADWSWEPSLAVGPDGSPVVAWTDLTGSLGEIYVRRWNGTAWVEMGSGSASGGGISATVFQSREPSLAISSAGLPIVAWYDYSDANAQIYVRRWNGSTWEELGGSASSGGISKTNGHSYRPSLTIDLDGLPIIAWEDVSLGDSEIYVRRWDGVDWVEMGSESATGGGISSNGLDSIRPSAAINGEGSPIITWADRSDLIWQIYVRRWSGSAWVELGGYSASTGGVSDNAGASYAPSLATSADGLPLIAWDDDTSGKRQIYLRSWQPQYAVYFPAQEMAPGLGWRAGIQVQNGGSDAAKMFFTGYEAGGNAVQCNSQTAAPGSSVTFLTDYSCPNGHAPFASSVVRTEQPAVAITNIYNRGVGLAGGQYRGTADGETTNELFFPLVKNDHNGRTTGFFVQNASDGVNDIAATFRVQGQTYTQEYNNIPPYTSIFVLPEDAAVPPGFGQVGSLTVMAPLPIAGASLEFDKGVSIADNLQTAKGFAPSESNDTLYCPLFRNAHANRQQTTGVQVQNASEAAQEISFTYVPVGGGQTISTSEDVQPGASATFYAPELGIPKGSLGSVTITGEADMVAVVNDQGYDEGQRNMTTYSCFPASQVTKEVFIPLYKEMYRGNTSGIQVQNVSGDGSSTKVTLTYRVRSSNTAVSFTHENPIPDGGSITFWGVSTLASPSDIKLLSGTPSMLAKTVGSVEIKADQPIVAIANETSYGPDASGQDAKNYEGFNNITPNNKRDLGYEDLMMSTLVGGAPDKWFIATTGSDWLTITAAPASTADINLSVLDENGQVIVDEQDLSPAGEVETISELEVTEPGIYQIIVATDFVQRTDYALMALNSESYNFIFRGTLDSGVERNDALVAESDHFWFFSATDGETISFQVSPDNQEDAYIEFYGSDGSRLMTIDDEDSGEAEKLDNYKILATGMYGIRVGEFDFAEMAYRILVDK